MKKVFLMMVVMVALSFGVELKGFTLGAKLTQEQKNQAVEHSNDGYVYKSSVGGVSGSIMVYILNDNRIYMIGFEPTDSYGNTKRIYESRVMDIINGMNTKYGIHLDPVSDTDADYLFRTKKDGYTYGIILDQNPYTTPEYKLDLFIINDSLNDISDQEDQKEVINDF